MPRISAKPKRLVYLVTLSLSLAALSNAGCSSDSSETPAAAPVLSHEAGIANISISKGALTPAFREDVRNYGVPTFYTASPDFALTVTLKDANSSLTIDGRAAISGQPFPIAIRDGRNTIQVAVTSEDGKNSNIASITTNQMPINTPLYVLDGYSGAFVEDALVTLRDAMTGEILLDSRPLPRAQMGKPFLGLDPDRRYNIYATAPGRATSCFANFNRTKEDYAALYCQRSDAPNMGFIYEAPVITDISFAPAQSDTTAAWPKTAFNLEQGVNVSNVMDVNRDTYGMRVTARGRNPISADNGSTLAPIFFATNRAADRTGSTTGNPVNVPPLSAANGGVPQVAIPKPGGWFETIYRFATWIPANIGQKDDYWHSIVVYDTAYNRTEQRVYVTLTTAAPIESDPDISQIKPDILALQTQTMGVSSELPGKNPAEQGDVEVNSVNPIDGHGGAIHTVIQFVNRNAAGANLGIRGYEIWLSIGDDANFKLVATYSNYAGLTTFDGIFATAPGGIYNFTDRNPTITPDIPHYYKVRTYNSNPANNGNGPGMSLWSDTIMVAPLQPFTTTAQDIYSQKLWPTFRFNVTNPALLNDPDMDVFAFTLYLKGVDGNYPFFYAPFTVDLTAEAKAADDAWGAGRPPVYIRDVESYGSSTGNTTGPDVPACDVVYAEDGVTIVSATPFAWLEPDGTFVVNTDSPRYRELLQRNAATVYFTLLYGGTLTPGAAYQWSIYGLGGGIISGTGLPGSIANSASNAALFYKAGAGTGSSWSFGSNQKYSYGSPEGFFSLIIDPDAE